MEIENIKLVERSRVVLSDKEVCKVINMLLSGVNADITDSVVFDREEYTKGCGEEGLSWDDLNLYMLTHEELTFWMPSIIYKRFENL